mmetsp:Transcript_948/g.2054  ORF Transcript_948/g.2054 Transcript_948/m.2054 type:complete len:162 (-) Transcript_948:95-580(-)
MTELHIELTAALVHTSQHRKLQVGRWECRVPYVYQISNVHRCTSRKVKSLYLLLMTTRGIKMALNLTDQTIHHALQHLFLIHVTPVLAQALLQPSLLGTMRSGGSTIELTDRHLLAATVAICVELAFGAGRRHVIRDGATQRLLMVVKTCEYIARSGATIG